MPRLERVRKELVTRRDSLLARHRKTLAAETEATAPQPGDDVIDLAGERTTMQLLDRLSEAELSQLQRIGRAIARVDSGEYGVCVGCGHDIEPARLALMPEADHCAACARTAAAAHG